MLYKIYIIKAGRDALKVGIAKDPKKRLKTMQTGNHRKLELIAAYSINGKKKAYEIEQAIHKCIKHCRPALYLTGEWFKCSKYIQKVVINYARVPIDQQENYEFIEENVKIPKALDDDHLESIRGIHI